MLYYISSLIFRKRWHPHLPACSLKFLNFYQKVRVTNDTTFDDFYDGTSLAPYLRTRIFALSPPKVARRTCKREFTTLIYKLNGFEFSHVGESPADLSATA